MVYSRCGINVLIEGRGIFTVTVTIATKMRRLRASVYFDFDTEGACCNCCSEV